MNGVRSIHLSAHLSVHKNGQLYGSVYVSEMVVNVFISVIVRFVLLGPLNGVQAIYRLTWLAAIKIDSCLKLFVHLHHILIFDESLIDVSINSEINIKRGAIFPDSRSSATISGRDYHVRTMTVHCLEKFVESIVLSIWNYGKNGKSNENESTIGEQHEYLTREIERFEFDIEKNEFAHQKE